MNGVTTVRESFSEIQGAWRERTYTDEEIIDTFGTNAEYNVCVALLKRAQAAEAKIERLRKLLGERA